jgi:hypothetical protein
MSSPSSSAKAPDEEAVELLPTESNNRNRSGNGDTGPAEYSPLEPFHEPSRKDHTQSTKADSRPPIDRSPDRSRQAIRTEHPTKRMGPKNEVAAEEGADEDFPPSPPAVLSVVRFQSAAEDTRSKTVGGEEGEGEGTALSAGGLGNFDDLGGSRKSGGLRRKSSASASSFQITKEVLPAEEGLLFGDPSTSSQQTGSTTRLRAVSRFPFKPGIFLFEFVTHLLYPISTPIVLAVQGYIACQNKWFLPSLERPSNFVLNIFFFTGQTWGPLIYALVVRADWAAQMVAVGFSFMVFRLLIVGGKYASYTSEMYHEVIFVPGGVAKTFFNLLATMWYHISPETLESQLQQAEELCGIELEGYSLLLLNGARVSAKRYMRQLLLQCYGDEPSLGYTALREVPSFLIALFPLWSYFEHAWNAPRFYTNIHDVLITVWVMIQIILFAPIVFRFMIIGLLHYQRQLRAQTALMNAVIVHHLHEAGKPIEDLYMLDLTAGENLVVWAKLRTLIHFFGHNVANRISFNTLATIIVTGFFIILMLQQAFAGKRDWKLLAFIVVDFLVLVSLALATFVTGAQLNSLDEKVVTLLRGEVLTLANEAEVQEPTQNKKNREKLRSLADYLHSRRSTHPVTVMYLPASASLVSALVGAIVSGALVFLQIAVNGVKL